MAWLTPLVGIAIRQARIKEVNLCAKRTLVLVRKGHENEAIMRIKGSEAKT